MPSTRARLLTSAACTIGLVLNAIAVPVYANPEGGTVVIGDATIARPNATTVAINQASDKAIIDWRSFSIAPTELVQFNQPGVRSITLNRVTGGDPSAILGTIKANGQVWLINPNGIAFGRSAKVDVAGLLATTLDIDNADFMAGRYRFAQSGSTSASVTNAGTLTISGAGLAALVAPTVANSGVIQARLGHINLASTHGFTLDFYGDGRINFLLNKDTSTALANSLGAPTVSNSGSLIADGGSILLTADTAKAVVDQTINMDGYIQARTVGTNAGTVILDGGAGAVSVSGAIDATGVTGGKIAVTGRAVDLTSTATLDASGDSGGGTVLVGGDAYGKGDLATAQTTSVAGGALIKVNAVRSGDAGKAIVWSNERTDFAGTIDATGGREGGNGGFAEVSGHELLNFTGKVDLRAANGALGTLLLDPRNVTISATGATPTLPSSGPSTFNPSADDSVIQVSTLQTALGLGNVIITTASNGTQAGDITVASSVSWSNASNLTLLANRNVVVNDGVTIANTGAGSLALRADSTGNGTGTVTFNGTGKVNYAGSTGSVSIFYNPAGGFTSPTSFASSVTTNGVVSNQLIAYMLVNNVTQLQAIKTNLTGNYAFGRDIDATATSSWNSGTGFIPIDLFFSGILDGQGHALSNLFIKSPLQDIGLFSGLAGGSIVRNLNVNNATVSGIGSQDSVGIIAGDNQGGTITHVTVSGLVTAGPANVVGGGVSNSQVGGITGNNSQPTSLITDSSSSATVNGGDNNIAGGIAGSNIGTITTSSSSGTVSGSYTGGLVGNNLGYIDKTFSTGSVTSTVGSATGAGYAGGLVYQNQGGSFGASITNSYATGNVTVKGVGPNGEFAAGLVAVNSGVITRVYAVGLITSTGSGAGLVAINQGSGSITNSYWDTQTSGQSTSVGGTGQTTSQLKTGLPSGFDPAIWAIDPAINNGYPYLKWQTASTAVPQNVSFGVATLTPTPTPITTGCVSSPIAPCPTSITTQTQTSINQLNQTSQYRPTQGSISNGILINTYALSVAIGSGNHLPIYNNGSLNTSALSMFENTIKSIPSLSANYVIDAHGFIATPGYVSSLNEQCVALVAALSGLSPSTKTWKPVLNVYENLNTLKPGTPIGTFTNGVYDSSHSAIFLGVGTKNGVQGMYILDQYNLMQIGKGTEYSPAEIRFYPIGSNPSTTMLTYFSISGR